MSSNYIVYGKSGCGYCTKAIEKLKDEGHNYNYIDIIESEIDKNKLASLVEQDISTIKTVPQIVYVPDTFSPNVREYVGGYTELEFKLKET